MKMHASLLLLSAAALCLCGPSRPAYFATTGPAPVAQADMQPDEADAAAGLGGLDGASFSSPAADALREATAPDDTTPARGRRGTVLTRNEARGQTED